MSEPSSWPFSNYNVFGIVNGISDARVREVLNRTFAGRAVKLASTLYVYGGNANSAAYTWLLAETGTLNTQTALIINTVTETGFGLIVGGTGVIEVGASATTTDFEAIMECVSTTLAHVSCYRDNTKTLIGSRIDTAGAFTSYVNPSGVATPAADRVAVGGYEQTGVDTLVAVFDDGTTRTLARKDVTISGPWTTGSVLFAGTLGFATEDASNFFWDDTLNELVVGGVSGLAKGTFYPTAAEKGIVVKGATSQSANLFESQISTGAIRARINNVGSFSSDQGLTRCEFFGQDAGIGASNIGVDNTGLGYGTLTANTSGNQNVAVGAFALIANTSGNQNVAVGVFALTANTSGSKNMAVGSEALIANTIGNSNMALGTETLRANTTGSDNAAAGTNALRANTTGSQNIAIGSEALTVKTTGDNNIAVGYRSLYTNITGANNLAVGHQALFGNKANDNLAVGYQALLSNNTGSSNLAVGYRAGYGDGTVDQQTSVDTYATFIGYKASRDASIPNTTVLTNITAIGKNAKVGQDNSIVLGGTGADAVKVGIGDVSPDAQLDIQIAAATNIGFIVQAAASQTANILELQESDGSIFVASGDGLGGSEFVINEQGEDIDFRIEGVGAANAFFVQGSDGNVGFGMTLPNQKLTIEGTLSLKEQAAANADTAAYGQIWVKTATPNQLWFTDDAGTDVQLGVSSITGTDTHVLFFDGANNPAGEAGMTYNKTTDKLTLAGRLGLTAAAGSTTDGDTWNDSTQKGIQVYEAGIEQTLLGVIFSATADATADAATEETLIGTGVGTTTLPANFFAVGKTVRIKAYGHLTSSIMNGPFEVKLKLGATEIATIGSMTPPSAASSAGWELEAVITCRTTGATGTVFVQGRMLVHDNGGSSFLPFCFWLTNAATDTIDTTASLALGLGSTSTDDGMGAFTSLTCTNLMLEVLN